MRITLNMQTSEALLNINNQQENITQLSQQIASGEVLSSPSDDPYAWAQTMNINQGLQEYKSILSGINFGTGWGQATESALNQLSDLVSQAQQVAISAQSETGSQESATLASQVNGILQQAVSLANSQYGRSVYLRRDKHDYSAFLYRQLDRGGHLHRKFQLYTGEDQHSQCFQQHNSRKPDRRRCVHIYQRRKYLQRAAGNLGPGQAIQNGRLDGDQQRYYHTERCI